MNLFPYRALRDDISIKEAAYLIIKGKKINKRFVKPLLLSFNLLSNLLYRCIHPQKNTELFDYLDDNIALTDDN